MAFEERHFALAPPLTPEWLRVKKPPELVERAKNDPYIKIDFKFDFIEIDPPPWDDELPSYYRSEAEFMDELDTFIGDKLSVWKKKQVEAGKLTIKKAWAHFFEDDLEPTDPQRLYDKYFYDTHIGRLSREIGIRYKGSPVWWVNIDTGPISAATLYQIATQTGPARSGGPDRHDRPLPVKTIDLRKKGGAPWLPPVFLMTLEMFDNAEMPPESKGGPPLATGYSIARERAAEESAEEELLWAVAPRGAPEWLTDKSALSDINSPHTTTDFVMDVPGVRLREQGSLDEILTGGNTTAPPIGYYNASTGRAPDVARRLRQLLQGRYGAEETQDFYRRAAAHILRKGRPQFHFRTNKQDTLYKKATIRDLLSSFHVVAPDGSTIWLMDFETMKHEDVLTLWHLIQPQWFAATPKIGTTSFYAPKGRPSGRSDQLGWEPIPVKKFWPVSELQWENGEFAPVEQGGPPSIPGMFEAGEKKMRQKRSVREDFAEPENALTTAYEKYRARWYVDTGEVNGVTVYTEFPTRPDYQLRKERVDYYEKRVLFFKNGLYHWPAQGKKVFTMPKEAKPIIPAPVERKRDYGDPGPQLLQLGRVREAGETGDDWAKRECVTHGRGDCSCPPRTRVPAGTTDEDLRLAHELVLYAENTGDLYADKKDIYRELRNLQVTNRYNDDTAWKVWLRWVKLAAGMYIDDVAPKRFTPRAMEIAAKTIAERYAMPLWRGEYDEIIWKPTDGAVNEANEAVLENPISSEDLKEAIPWVKVTRDAALYEKALAQGKAIGVIDSPAKVHALLSPALATEDQEIFIVILIDVRGNCRGVAEVHRGTRSRVAVSVPDIMRVAVAGGAEGFIVVHNHPSGNATPSDADGELTEAVKEAAVSNEIAFLDHVIVCPGEYYSFGEEKLTKVKGEKEQQTAARKEEPEEPQHEAEEPEPPRENPTAAETPRLFSKEWLVEFGEYIWRSLHPFLGGEHATDPEIIDAAIAFLGDLENKSSASHNEMTFAVMLQSPDTQAELVGLYRFAEAAYPNYTLGHKLAAALLVTNATPEAVAVAQPPFDGFIIDVPNEMIFIEGMDKKPDEIRTILVARMDSSKGWRWMFRAYSSRGSAMYRWGMTSEMLLTPISEEEAKAQAYGLFQGEVTDLDGRALHLVGRLIINVCLTLSDPANVASKGAGHEWWKTRSDPSKRMRSSGQPRVRLFALTTPVEHDFREAVAGFAHGKRESLTLQHIVAGHYKQQPFGQGRTQRKTIWIQPYPRGPEGAPRAFRAHKLKEKGAAEADEGPGEPPRRFNGPNEEPDIEFIVAPIGPIPKWLTMSSGGSHPDRIVARVSLADLEDILREDHTITAVLAQSRAKSLLDVLNDEHTKAGYTDIQPRQVYANAVRYFQHGARFARFGGGRPQFGGVKKKKYGVWAGMKLRNKETIRDLLQAVTIVEPDTHSTVWLFDLEKMKYDRVLTLWELIQPTWEPWPPPDRGPGQHFAPPRNIAFRPERTPGVRWRDPGPGDPPVLWPLSERMWEEGEWPPEVEGGPPAARYGMEGTG